MTYNDYICPRI